MQEAFDNGYIKHRHIEKIINHYEDNEILKLDSEVEEQILKDYCIIQNVEYKPNIYDIDFYGEYSGCYAVMVDVGEQYTQAIRTVIIDGVKITYPDGRSILIWKSNS
jgi:hypothetical protein